MASNPDFWDPKLKTVAFTGHRPKDLTHVQISEVKSILANGVQILYDNGYKRFISGVALGVDTWAAQAVLMLKASHPEIVLVSAIPFAGQSSRWTGEDTVSWKNIIHLCDVSYLVHENKVLTQEEKDNIFKIENIFATQEDLPYYTIANIMQKRNEWMVNHAHLVFAIFTGKPGGTKNCVNYAKKKNKKIVLYNPFEPELGIQNGN